MAEVLVAMSGGVDSAVAAGLLAEQGHRVTGVHLKLAELPLHQQVLGRGCCSLDDAQDARRSAQILGLPFYVWDLSERFAAEVQAPFAATYAGGATPNPCVACNERVKYAGLLERADALGFDALATGHHARLRRGGVPVIEPGPGVSLHRAADRRKDQSYVLYMATAEQLAMTLLPVGEHPKSEIRRLAIAWGLRVADKPDSYDVCFIPDGDTAGYLAGQLPPAPGPIVDVDGAEVGRHDGVWRFTVGQRRGLGLAGIRTPGSDRPEPRYVVDVDAPTSTVVVGARELLACRRIEVAEPSWVAGRMPSGPVRVQVRSQGASVPARLEAGVTGGSERAVRCHLDEPLHGVATAQAAVVYDADDERCLGGGRITEADRPWVRARAERAG